MNLRDKLEKAALVYKNSFKNCIYRSIEIEQRKEKCCNDKKTKIVDYFDCSKLKKKITKRDCRRCRYVTEQEEYKEKKELIGKIIHHLTRVLIAQRELLGGRNNKGLVIQELRKLRLLDFTDYPDYKAKIETAFENIFEDKETHIEEILDSFIKQYGTIK